MQKFLAHGIIQCDTAIHQEVAGLEGAPTLPRLLGRRFLFQSRLVTTVPDQAAASWILLLFEKALRVQGA